MAAVMMAVMAVWGGGVACAQGNDVGPIVFGGISLLSAGLPGVVTAIALSTKGAERPAWRTSGYVFGALNVAAGAVAMGAYSGTEAGLALGGALLLIGVLDLGLAIYRSRKANRVPSKVSLVPVSGVGAKGLAFAGVGVRVSAF